MRFIVGIAAGKGGVGKSSLTVNLALALQKMGRTVGVMDADIYGPSIRKMLPEDTLPINSEESNKIIPAKKRGIKLISMSYFAKDEEEAVIVRAPIANGIIKQFIHSVHWGQLDCLLIDFPPGTGDIQLTLMQEMRLSGGIVITTPQEVALQDVSKAIQLFHQMHVPVLGLVENMSYFEDHLTRHYLFGKDGGRRLCEREGIPLLGTIPIDQEISKCCDEGLNLFEVAELKPCTKSLEAIALSVWEQLESFEKLEGSYFKKMHPQDRYQFTIEWTDGKISTYKWSDLQRHCTCAQCHEAKPAIDEEVFAVQVVNVGRYALKIDFTTGCSKGVYTFAMLRNLSNIQ